jgi:hypothetical protein
MTSPAASTERRPGQIAVAVLAGLVHVVVGYFYLAGGLLIPGAVLYPLWVLWVLLAVALVWLAVKGSWWTIAIPLVAAAIFVLMLVLGDQVFGWTA